LARKPGALRNGAPFKDWVLPAAMERVRRKLAGVNDGNRQMVDILTAVLSDGLPPFDFAESNQSSCLGDRKQVVDLLPVLKIAKEQPGLAWLRFIVGSIFLLCICAL